MPTKKGHELMQTLFDETDFRAQYRWSGQRQVGVRKVVTPSKKTTKGYFASIKMQAQIPYESTLERLALSLFEVDPAVQEIYAQPEIMRLEIDGVTAKHYPDFRLVRADRDCLVEVKPSEKAEEASYGAMFQAARQEAAKRSLDYLVLTEKEIERQPRLDTAEIILRYAARWIDDTVAAELREALQDGPKTVDELVGGEQVRWQVLAGLIARSQASIDWWQPFTGRSAVSFVGRGRMA